MTRFTNLALAALVAAAYVTGLVAQATGTAWARIPVVLHGVAAIAVVVLFPWKSPVVRSGLSRRRGGRVWLVTLGIAIVLTVGSGLFQMTGTVRKLGPLTTMQVHIGSATLALALGAAHYVMRPVRPRREDLSRRNFLRAMALGLGAGAAWLGWEGVVRVAGWPGGERRFTGSHERGSGDPAAMPVTQWFDDDVQRVAPGSWEISVGGMSIDEADVARLPTETVTATLDCTSGWHSEQVWRGVPLDRILDVEQARSIVVRSKTGYSRRFPAADAAHLLLAFEVGAAPLSAGHGYPARIVAPGRRGFWWVKWVESVESSGVPWWLQLPFPIT